MDFDFTKQPGRSSSVWTLTLQNNLGGGGRHANGLVTDARPLVSVIVPYYNAKEYFEQTFNCIVNQTFPWFECIIVNDGSTDTEAVELTERLAQTDERFRLVHQENARQSAARNRGIAESRTDYILPLDNDDLIEPTTLETLYWALQKNPDCGAAYSNSIGFQDIEYLSKRPFNAKLMKAENFLTNCALFRKSVLYEAGLYHVVTDKTIHFNEDWHLWLKLLSHSVKLVHIEDYSFWYRRRNSMFSEMLSDSKLRDFNKELISEVAKTVDTSVTAVEFPRPGQKDRFLPPKMSDCELKIRKTHDKTNILMLAPWMVRGGADLFNLMLMRDLPHNKFNIGIVTTVYSGDDSIRQQFAEWTDDIFELTHFLDITDWAEFISYYLKTREVDVLFLSNSFYGYYLVPWLKQQFPELVVVDYVHYITYFWCNGGQARLSGVFGEFIDRTLVCYDKLRAELRDWGGRKEDSIHTLYIGVDSDKFRASNIERGTIRSELGIPQERKIVLFPCRLVSEKRPFLMIAIAQRMKNDSIAFLVVGDGVLLEEMKQKVKQSGLSSTVFFAGMQKDMLPYYRDADLTLVCSLKEGLSLTAYESCSMGVPVITSNVGGQDELIDNSIGYVLPLYQDEVKDFQNWNYEEREIQQYVDAIRELFSDEVRYKQMSTACRKRIEDRFTVKNMLERFQDEIYELMQNRRLSNVPKTITTCADELVTLHTEHENMAQELEAAWSARCWFKDKYDALAAEQLVVYNEMQTRDDMYSMSHELSMKHELLRIVNSRLGRFMIKVFFKLRLNKLFR